MSLNPNLEKAWLSQTEGKVVTMYIIKCERLKEQFYKIGLTVKPIRRRFSGRSAIPYSFNIVATKSFDINLKAREVESEIINLLQCNKHKPLLNFKGSSECFNIEAKEKLDEFIRKHNMEVDVSA
jgi:hypothetical protein